MLNRSDLQKLLTAKLLKQGLAFSFCAAGCLSLSHRYKCPAMASIEANGGLECRPIDICRCRAVLSGVRQIRTYRRVFHFNQLQVIPKTPTLATQVHLTGAMTFSPSCSRANVIDRDLMVTMGDNLCGLFDSRSGGPTRSWCSLF